MPHRLMEMKMINQQRAEFKDTRKKTLQGDYYAPFYKM